MFKKNLKSLIAGVLTLSIISGVSYNYFSPTKVQAAASFAYGADVSYLPQMEAAGYTFKNDNGVTEDCLKILKEHGIDSVRLRTWVNPSSDPKSGHCSEAETVAMAKRCKAAGLRVMIDFQFGDTWNSKGKQNAPAAWANMTYTQMLSAMNNYVYHFMNDLKSSGVTPAWVQAGNEENMGICYPTGSLKYNPAQMTGLLNAAYNMVKKVFPSTLVIIHLASPQDMTANQAWFDTYKANGGKWDISGFSTYPGASAAPGIVANIKTMQAKYGKPVMVVEVGGRCTKATDTKNCVTTMINGLKAMPNGSGLGVFYWEPEVYAPFENAANPNGAFNDTTHQPTVALDAFIH